jgi:hypothetical protein
MPAERSRVKGLQLRLQSAKLRLNEGFCHPLYIQVPPTDLVEINKDY